MKQCLIVFLVLFSFGSFACELNNGEEGKVIGLRLGDWSCDGHCVSEVFQFCTNKSGREIKKSFRTTLKTLTYDFTEEVQEYEDATIQPETVKELSEIGINENYFECFDDECYFSSENSFNSSIYFYALIYLELSQITDPELVFTPIVSENELNIGGYGLMGY